MSLGRTLNPFEDAQSKQLLTILGFLVTGMLFCCSVAAFSEANLVTFNTLTPFNLPHLKRLVALRSIVAWHPRRIVPLATTLHQQPFMWPCCYLVLVPQQSH